MDGATLQQSIMAGGLAILGTLGGIYASALRALSRSRLELLLNERGETMNGFLRRVIDDERTVRLAAALWQALAMGAFLLYAAVLWVAPASHWQSWVLRAILLLAVTGLLRAVAVLAGEAASERLVREVAALGYFLTYPLRPFVRVILVGQQVVARSLGFDPNPSSGAREEEVMAAVSDGVLDEVVEEEQKEMIEGIFDLKDADVADVLTPRTEMVSLVSDLSLSDAISVAVEEGHSRLPVHGGTRDNVLGIFYVRDAFRYWETPRDELPPLQEILRKPVFVPETKKVSELLHEMQRNQVHLCVVLDEYGGTAGVVTIEDVLEEIVGEIQDEFDEGEIPVEIQRLDDDTYVVEGQTHVHEVNEVLHADVIPENDDYETVAGFVLDELGHIPQSGERFTYGPLELEVLAADERKVDRIKVVRNRTAEEGG